MRRSIHVALAFLLSGMFSLYSQTDTVTILHLNDTHNNLAPIGPRDLSLTGSLGGIARAATLIGMERMADPKALLLHAGDFSIGDLFYNMYVGAGELQILASLGCDAMTLGNHEFDLMPSTLVTALDNGFYAGGFPVLCANINLQDPALESLRKYVSSYTIKQVGNVKVGIFGLTTPETNLISQPAPAVIDTPFLPAAAMVETLMTNNCSVIICLSHLGFTLDKMIAENVPGINLIVGGHDHLAFAEAKPVQNPSGDTTWIVQANAFYLDLGKVRLTVNGGKVRLLDYALEAITNAIAEEPTAKASVDWMIQQIEGVYGPVYTAKIAEVKSFFNEVADSLTFGGPHDTPIGDLVTDAFRAATGTQIAMEVGGSTAEPLYPGPIVAADAFRVVGYGFNTVNGLGYRLVTFDIAGAALYAGLEFGLSNIEQDDEFLVQVSGMKYTYDPQQPSFGRVTSVEVGGTPLDPQAMYTVTANEFVPMFLDKLGIPYGNAHICGDTTEFSALAGYIQQRGSLTPTVEGRVLVPPVGIRTPRQGDGIPGAFVLAQNYPNPFSAGGRLPAGRQGSASGGNPTTTIGYTIGGVVAQSGAHLSGVEGPAANNVRLAVYDLLGREVAVLLNEKKGPGNYEVRFDASGFSSGVYFYRLTAGVFTQTRSMLLIK